jgi:hypothetical protein
MFIEIIKDEKYVNREAISQFYYDDEYGAFYLSMINGSEFKIADEKVENLIKVLEAVPVPEKKESA